MLADGLFGSTRETALPYNDGMRSPIILLPLLFILADGAACKDDDEPTGGEFGDPCGGDTDMSCGEGLECSTGYCTEKCVEDGDCQPVDGYLQECGFGLCHIRCDEKTQSCPQSLGQPLECVQLPWCSSAS